MSPGYTGIYLPIITPFLNGKVDYSSYEKMVEHYIKKGIHGIIPLGTTGESPTVSHTEYHNIAKTIIDLTGGRIPVFLGVSGNDTSSLIKKLEGFEDYDMGHNYEDQGQKDQRSGDDGIDYRYLTNYGDLPKG